MTAPNLCPAGHYCPAYSYYTASSLFYEKIRCPAGTYNPSEGEKDINGCLACPTGKYCGSEGLIAASGDCSIGYFCDQYADSPTPQTPNIYGYYGPCPAGYYCASGASSAVPCPIGTYSTQILAIDSSVCVLCKEGMYCDSLGLTAPAGYCEVGYYCPEGTITSTPAATFCPVKTYCPLGSSSPKVCPVGYYQEATKQGKCLQCPTGYYCIFGERMICPSGYYCE